MNAIWTGLNSSRFHEYARLCPSYFQTRAPNHSEQVVIQRRETGSCYYRKGNTTAQSPFKRQICTFERSLATNPAPAWLCLQRGLTSAVNLNA